MTSPEISADRPAEVIRTETCPGVWALRTGKATERSKDRRRLLRDGLRRPRTAGAVRRRDERAQRRRRRGDRGQVSLARLRQRDRHWLLPGAVPVAIALAHEHLTGGGFDLPPLKPLFDAYAARCGVADRLSFTPGDFFADPLPHADVLIMGHILHDWNLDEKRMLLVKAYVALPDGGSLIVYDAIIDDDRQENAFGLLMSLNMLIEGSGGFDYTGADGRAWMAETGFSETYVEHLVGPDSMVVGIK